MTSLTPKVDMGDIVGFNISIHNNGETDLANIIVEDYWDIGLNYLSCNLTDKWSYSIVGERPVFKYNDKLLVNEKTSFCVYFFTNKTGNLNNHINVKSDYLKPISAYNSTFVLQPNLDIKKTSLDEIVILNSQVRFEIMVNNSGEINLTNIKVTEKYPNELVYDSFIGIDEWDYELIDGNHIWTYKGILKVNESSKFIVIFNTTKIGNYSNVVIANSTKTPNIESNATFSVINPVVSY